MSLPRTKKFKSMPSAKEVMVKMFWDINGPTLKYYQNHGQKVNSTWYCAMSEEELKPINYNNTTEI